MHIFTRLYRHITKTKLRTGAYVIIVLGLIFGVYTLFSQDETTLIPVLGTVERGQISSEVSGTGQIFAQKTATLTSKVAGDVRKIYTVNGTRVTEGQVLFELDATDAAEAVRDARLSLASAELNYLTTERTQRTSLENKERAFAQANAEYASQISVAPLGRIDSTTTVTPPTISGTYEYPDAGEYILEKYNCSGGYCIAYSGLEKGTFAIQLGVATPVGTRGIYVTYSSINQVGTNWKITLASPAASNYYDARTTRETSQIELADQKKAYEQALEAQRITVEERKNALNDALRTLSYYTIRAPFTGTIGNIGVAEYNRISSGASLATLVAEDKYVEITLNEVDITKVQQGQEARITLDALPNLRIRGTVASVDSVGVVTQGVVEYTVQIILNSNKPEDLAQIRAGMSAEVTIVTAQKQDVLIVPASAVKSLRGRSYVEAPLAGSASTTQQIFVETGITDDISTEITSGLTEGQEIIIRTTSQGSSNTAAPSIFSAAGVRAPSGGSGAQRATAR